MPAIRISAILIGTGALSLGGAPANAMVTDVSVRFQTFVGDRFDVDDFGNPSTNLGNESYDISGGLELVPFSRQSVGGYSGFSHFAGIGFNATLSPSGELTGSESNAAGEEFTFKPNSSIRSQTTIDFVVTSPALYDFTINAFFDNDGGTNSIRLIGPNGTVFFTGGNLPGFESDGLESGSLAPGAYTLISSAGSRADISYQFSIVPAPPVLAALGVFGMLAGRRRR